MQNRKAARHFRRWLRWGTASAVMIGCGGDPTVQVGVNLNVSGNGNGNDNGSTPRDAGPALAQSTDASEEAQTQTVEGDADAECQSDSCGAASVDIDADGNRCPEIFPSAVKIDETTWSFVIAATDADGNPLSFAWSATGGQFSRPTSSQTSYTCAAGVQTLTATVSDGACVVSWTLTLTCPS
jgi:hypothetical protein